MLKGAVKSIDHTKGFGFIAQMMGPDCFFHRRDVSGGTLRFNEIQVGSVVTYEAEETDRGPRATKVRFGHSR